MIESHFRNELFSKMTHFNIIDDFNFLTVDRLMDLMDMKWPARPDIWIISVIDKERSVKLKTMNHNMHDICIPPEQHTHIHALWAWSINQKRYAAFHYYYSLLLLMAFCFSFRFFSVVVFVHISVFIAD